MHGSIDRLQEGILQESLQRAPVTVLLGPRQCGKTTLARHFIQKKNLDHVFLDLQNRSDRNKMLEPEFFLSSHRKQLVCLDEIQLLPEFFSILRSEVDQDRRNGRFLLLGSASQSLLKQTTESLAGRVAFIELTPFFLKEVETRSTWNSVWLRGGFPNSVLALNDRQSFQWRRDFVRTFLERDIPQLGFAIPMPIIERLWTLLAHYHGQVMNYSKAAASMDLSIVTLKKYIAILEQTYMIRTLKPAESNLKKRLVHAPKIYIRDSGLLHYLLDIHEYDDLLAHPSNGASWEGFVIENILSQYPEWKPSFIRTSNGAEIDLLLERGSKRIAIECKLSKAPQPSRGLHSLIQDLQPHQSWIISPVETHYQVQNNLQIAPLSQFKL